MSFSRVCLNMNFRNGTAARSSATLLRDLLLHVRLQRVLVDVRDHGIHDEERQQQREADQHLVGRHLLRAERGRTNESTTTTRVNDVTSTSSVGASEMTVSSSKICSA